MAMGMSDAHARAALEDSSSHDRAAGLALNCERRAHVTHMSLEERVSADDTLNVACRGQLGRPAMACRFVGGEEVR